MYNYAIKKKKEVMLMDFLNSLIVGIFGFLYYCHIAIAKLMVYNFIHYPFATIFISVVVFAMISFILFKLMMIKNRHSRHNNNNDIESESVGDVQMYIWLLILLPFLLPFKIFADGIGMFEYLKTNKREY